MPTQCTCDNCDRPAVGRGLCSMHWQRWKKHGDPLVVEAPSGGYAPRPLAERFWEKVDRSGGPDACWEWTASRYPAGYGQFGITRSKSEQAHRVAYRLTYGEISDGLEIDHRCHNRGCVNPAHLDAVTHHVNVMRSTGPSAIHAGQTHCIHGHPLSGDNLYMWRGQRHCRSCRLSANQRRYGVTSDVW